MIFLLQGIFKSLYSLSSVNVHKSILAKILCQHEKVLSDLVKGFRLVLQSGVFNSGRHSVVDYNVL